MAIHFVTGRPGAGKSFYSMKLIIEELRGTERRIVTNLAILPDKLGEYLHDQFFDTFDLLSRLHIISDEEIEFFYIHRGRGLDPLAMSFDKKERPEAFDIAGAQKGGGVFYILDEVHLKFGARNWQNMGQAATYYSSQHRKLGDDVVLITQAPKMVDTTFRSLAQDYTVLRNHALEKLLFFKQPKVFTRQTFLDLPTGNAKAQEKSVFRLDLAVADCYDTSQGVGIHERGDADTKGDKRKGLPWWVGVIAFVVAIFLIAQLPGACGQYVAGEITGGAMVKGYIPGADNNSTDDNGSETIDVQPPKIPIWEVDKVVEKVPEPVEERVMITGYISQNKGGNWDFRVLLENGEFLSFQKGEIIGIHSTHVEADDGRKYFFERPINVLKLRGIPRAETIPGRD